MKITREADYALRILYTLCKSGRITSARDISQAAGVSLRFTLKILSKLSANDLVDSKKGAQGGYFLKKDSSEISVYDIIECIDGDISISHCLSEGFQCTRVDDVSCCNLRKLFEEISSHIKKELSAVKLSDFIK